MGFNLVWAILAYGFTYPRQNKFYVFFSKNRYNKLLCTAKPTMTSALILGPLLGYDGESTSANKCFANYNVAILLNDADIKNITQAQSKASSYILQLQTAQSSQQIPFFAIDTKTAQGRFLLKAAIKLELRTQEQTFSYSILDADGKKLSQLGNDTWTFYVPANNQSPRIVFASCNGFSSGRLAMQTTNPPYMWQVMRGQLDKSQAHYGLPASWRSAENTQAHYAQAHLLIMGGDQLYADEIFSGKVPALRDWLEMDEASMLKTKATSDMLRDIDAFYENLYIARWGAYISTTQQKPMNAELAHVLATIPHIMMWDDHDIFDGWGSYSTALQQSSVFQAIYTSAAKYFQLFQLRGQTSSIEGGHSYYRSMNQFGIYMFDMRSQRTQTQLISAKHWQAIKDHTEKLHKTNKLAQYLLMTIPIPLIYRSFKNAQNITQSLGIHTSLSDDIMDQWSVSNHEGEQAQWLNFFADIKKRYPQVKNTIILSGDVHVACAGFATHLNTGLRIYQVVSSGIMHPSPSYLEWLGVCAASNENPRLSANGYFNLEMITPPGMPERYLRTRNFLTIEHHKDKIWVHWEYENRHKDAVLPSLVID